MSPPLRLGDMSFSSFAFSTCVQQVILWSPAVVLRNFSPHVFFFFLALWFVIKNKQINKQKNLHIPPLARLSSPFPNLQHLVCSLPVFSLLTPQSRYFLKCGNCEVCIIFCLFLRDLFLCLMSTSIQVGSLLFCLILR